MCLHMGLFVHFYVYFAFWRVRVIGLCAFSQVSGPDWGLMLPTTSIHQAWKTLTTVPFLTETSLV